MICGDTIENVRVPHRGNITDNIIEAAYSIVEEFDMVNGAVEEMKSTLLLPAEAEIFAEAALELRYEEDSPISPSQLLMSRRVDDRKNDLWTGFNRVQENIMRGGLRGRTKDGKRTSTRAVQGIDSNIKLNKALWVLAERMAELKMS
jgi:hypothetical protein